MYSAHHAAVGTALTVGGYLAAGPVGVLVGLDLMHANSKGILTP